MFISICCPQPILKQTCHFQILTEADIEHNQDPPDWHFLYKLALKKLNLKFLPFSQFITKIKQLTNINNYNP